MAVPELSVEVSWSTGPLATPVWVDESTVGGDPRIVSVDVDAGRKNELVPFSASTATVVFENSDGRLDKNNPSSPLHANKKLMRPIRIRDTFAGTTHPQFQGFIVELKKAIEYPEVARMKAECVDAFGWFATIDLGNSPFDLLVRRSNPKTYFRFDEPATATTVLDTGSAGHVGTVVGSPLLAQEGLVTGDPGTSISFAAGSMVEVPGSLFTTASFAIEFMINRSILVDGQTVTIAEQWPYVRLTAEGVDDRGRFSLGLLSGGFGTPEATTGGCTSTIDYGFDGQDHHVMVVVNAGMPSIWIDGTDRTVAPDGMSGAPGTASTTTIGGSRSSGESLGGRLDNFVVYDFAPTAATVTAHATAALEAWEGDTTGARLGRLLDAVDWPSADRAIDAGRSTLQAASFGNGKMLDHMQRVAETEWGRLFMAPDNKVTFHERHTPLKPPYTTSQGTFSDAPTGAELGYEEAAEPVFSVELIKNEARVSSQGQSTAYAADQVSIDEYGLWSFNRSGLLGNDANEMASATRWVIAHYSEPQERYESVTLLGIDDGTAALLFPHILGRRIGERVTLDVNHPGSPEVTAVVLVEGYSKHIESQYRQVTWALSPADTQEYWVLGTSALGVGTRPAF